MYLFRVLNEFDINSNILENGIASKRLIYDLTYSYYKNNKDFINLTSQEQERFIKENMIDYLKKHQQTLEKKYQKYCHDIFKTIISTKENETIDPKNIIKISYYLSTLNKHLVNGTKTYTEWISLSKNLDSINNYYNSQTNHKVAIITSNTNGYVDDKTLAIDLSTRSIINNDQIFCNKMNHKDYLKYLELGDEDLFIENLIKKTKKEFMGYNFSIFNKEVCYYQYIPSNQVVSVLESLQIDLIKTGLFNEEFLNLDKKQQQLRYLELKNKLLRFVNMMKDPYMLYIYEELYLKNKNMNTITSNTQELEKIKHTKKLILGLASKLYDIEIKH